MRKQLLRLLRIAPLALLFAGVAFAQTTGTIIGVVTDASTNKPVAGALIIATSPNLQGEQTAVTDGAGNFRITLLPSGPYKLSVQLEGFNPAERSDITVRVDKTIRANLAVVPSAVQMEEQVVRTGVAPVINVGTAESGTVVSKEFIASVPMGRDFQSVAIVTPGAVVDVYGVSFAGASSPENNYILDGMNVTDPAFGTQGSQLLTNFIQEVDIKSGNFMPEYGRSTGGIINVVTKSGSNEYHGSVFGNWQPGQLSPDPKAVFRFGEAIGRASRPSEGSYQIDFGAEVGGPILNDRLWFYAGFAPVFRVNKEERLIRALDVNPELIDADGDGVLDPGTSGRIIGSKMYEDDNTQYQLTSKLTYLFNPNNTFTVSYYMAPSERTYLAAANALETNGLQTYESNSYDLIGRYASKLFGRRAQLEVQGGWHRQTVKDDPTTINGISQRDTSAVQWDPTHNLTEFESVDASCAPQDIPAGAATAETTAYYPCAVRQFVTGGRGYMQDATLDRFSGKVAASFLVNLLGQHNWKAGVDYERGLYDNTKFYGGNAYIRELSSGRASASDTPQLTFLDFRRYGTALDENGLAADVGPGIDSFSDVSVKAITNSTAFFLQDSYSPIDGLTLNAGVRWELQNMYAEDVPGDAPLDINDNIGPRVQAIYDFTRSGRSKISASWGRFYEMIPLDIGDRQFGHETTVRVYRGHPANTDFGCGINPAPVAGGSAGADGTFASPVSCPVIDSAFGAATPYGTIGSGTEVAPGLKGQYVDMFGAGMEYEFLPDLSFGVSYEGRRLGRIIEDVSPDDGTNYFIMNPGDTGAFSYDDDHDPTTEPIVLDPDNVDATDSFSGHAYQFGFPKPERKYDAVTFELRKNFSKNWLAQASYTFSNFRGNYPGLFRTETAQLDPNILSEFDLPSLLGNRNGPLPGDRPHQIKLYGAYVFNVGSNLNILTGATFRGQSGSPVNFLGSHPEYGQSEGFVLPRGFAGRTPFITQVDLRGAVEYTIRAPYAVKFSVDVLNLLNRQETQAVDEDWTFDSVQAIQGGHCESKNAASKSDPIAAALADCPDLAYLKTIDGRPVTINPNFGRPARGAAPDRGYALSAFQLPIAFRFGLALTF